MLRRRAEWLALLKSSHRRAAALTGSLLALGFIAAWSIAWAQAGKQAAPALPEVNLSIGGSGGDGAPRSVRGIEAAARAGW